MTYLNVPFAEKNEAKALGARWDQTARKWYVPSGRDTGPFSRWLPPAAARERVAEQPATPPAYLDVAEPVPSGSDVGESVILRAPLDVAQANTHCWKCQGWTVVVAIGAEDVEVEGDRMKELVLVSDVEALPSDIATILFRRWPLYRVAYSKTAGGRYYMNHGEKCGATQGDFFLHHEPGGAFFTMNGAAARRIVAHRVPLQGSFRLRASVSISSPNLLDRYATRVDLG